MCERQTCGVGVNLGRGKHYFLQCNVCGLKLPLEWLEKHSEYCPACLERGLPGILIWTPAAKPAGHPAQEQEKPVAEC